MSSQTAIRNTRRQIIQSLIAVSAAAFGIAASSAAHADQLDDIKKKGELVVGVLGTDEPNSFIDAKSREIVGYEVDLARAVAAKLGVKLSIKQLAVAARIPELQQGRVDLLIDGVLRELEKSGEANQLFVKWYGPETRLKFPSRNFKIDSDKVDA